MTIVHPSPQRRWLQWQSSLVSQRYLTEDAAAQGYTLVRIAPHQREAFLDVVSLLLAQGQCAAHDLEPPAAWHEWRAWTRRLTAYLVRLAQNQVGTAPLLPEAFTL